MWNEAKSHGHGGPIFQHLKQGIELSITGFSSTSTWNGGNLPSENYLFFLLLISLLMKVKLNLCDKRGFWFLELHNHFYYCCLFIKDSFSSDSLCHSQKRITFLDHASESVSTLGHHLLPQEFLPGRPTGNTQFWVETNQNLEFTLEQTWRVRETLECHCFSEVIYDSPSKVTFT